MQIVKKGIVKVEETFLIKEFDENDDWKERVIPSGHYDYRVINVNGWKPRQLLIHGKWTDVCGSCKELEKILNEKEEQMDNKLFKIVLLEKPGCEGLTKADLYDMLSHPEAFPVEIGDINGNSSAMGFITTKAAEKLQYEYNQDSEPGQFISSILDDIDKKSEDGTYAFKDLGIWMNRR